MINATFTFSVDMPIPPAPSRHDNTPGDKLGNSMDYIDGSSLIAKHYASAV